jgi:NAD(P)-dependent dehydrogenase (short-subunit alcohol dehydrogenase family)
VRSREQLHDAFSFARSAGPLTAVINNASALSAFHPEAPLEHWDELIATDFLGTVWSTRLAIDAMREHGGAIVNVSSTSALDYHRVGGSPMYDVAKSAILQFSARLAFLRQCNIRVNCIIPHWIAVPFLVEYVSGLSPQERKELRVPERLIPVDEIAAQVNRLATDITLAGEAIIWRDGTQPELFVPEQTFVL